MHNRVTQSVFVHGWFIGCRSVKLVHKSTKDKINAFNTDDHAKIATHTKNKRQKSGMKTMIRGKAIRMR